MGSASQLRLLVLLLFFGALITFAAFYRPVDAQSHAAHTSGASVMPVGKPLEIKAPLGLPPAL